MIIWGGWWKELTPYFQYWMRDGRWDMALNDWWNSKRSMVWPKEQIRELLCVGAFTRGLMRKSLHVQRRKKRMFLSSRQKIRRSQTMKMSKALRCCARTNVIFRHWLNVGSWLRSDSKMLSRTLGRHGQTGSIPLREWEDGEVCQMLLSKSLNSPFSDKFLKMKCIDIASHLQPFHFATILLDCYRFVTTFSRVLRGSCA